MSYRAKVVRLEGERVELSLEDGQTLALSLKAFEGTPKEGQEVMLLAVAVGSEDAGRQAMARELLNGLLGS
jgi:hypothetical protein